MDAELFKQRFIPLHKKLYSVAYRLLENTADAEDAVQETYVKLWEKRDELETLRNPESFCIVIIRNHCMDILRSVRNRMDSYETTFKEKPDECSLIGDIENKESLTIIDRLIKILPEQQQLVFKLRHQGDCSLEEIEEITGLTAVNIRVMLSRCRKAIREQYKIIYSNDTIRC